MAKTIKNLTGKRYGRLEVIELGARAKDGRVRWRCLCDCGEYTEVQAYSLHRGATRSCGCLRDEYSRTHNTVHGMAQSALYTIWRTMKQRCTNPNATGYKSHGALGIGYHPRFEKFTDFLANIPTGYREGSSLVRIDQNGDYTPTNVVWRHPNDINGGRPAVKRPLDPDTVRLIRAALWQHSVQQIAVRYNLPVDTVRRIRTGEVDLAA